MNRIFGMIVLILTTSGCSSIKQSEKKSITGTDFHMHVHTPPKEYEDDLQFTAQRALFAADSI